MGRLIGSAITILAALILGATLLQASAVSFDYMKLNKLPLYSSAETLPDYARKMYMASHDMGGQVSKIREVFEERATADLTVYEKELEAKHAITTARMALRNALTDPAELGKLNQADLSFVTTDSFFNRHCSQTDNQQADVMKAGLAVDASPVAAKPGPVNGAASAWAAMCTAFACDGAGIPDGAVRAGMICTQRDLQDSLNRKEVIDGFQYDSAKYISDLMKLDYPDFAEIDVANAVRVTGSYRAMVDSKGKPGAQPPAQTANSAAKTAGPGCDCGPGDGSGGVDLPPPAWNAWFWNWMLAVPLSVMYLILSFLFGCAGCVSSNLYRVTQSTPAAALSVWYTIIAGGGSAILVLIITMAGFQFLAVGASSADLAYPNPLVVCGLSVAVGLNGDKVLIALREWISRIFSSTSPPPAPDAPGGR